MCSINIKQIAISGNWIAPVEIRSVLLKPDQMLEKKCFFFNKQINISYHGIEIAKYLNIRKSSPIGE